MDINIKDIESVGLTAEDFQTLLDALDVLPEKGLAQEICQHLFLAMMMPPGHKGFVTEIKARAEQGLKTRQQRAEAMKDDLTLLKGKLILLKRHLLGDAADRWAKEVLSQK